MSEHASKRNGFLTLILLAANLVMIAWIAVSFMNKDKRTPVYSSSYSESTSGSKPAAAAEPKSADLTGMIPQLPDIEESEWTETEGVQENTPEEKTDSREPEPSASPAESAPLSDDRRPVISDFDWYFDEVSYYGVWDDAEMITDLGELTGDWKAYIYYDPENQSGRPLEMLLNVDISVGQKDISVTCDWYCYREAGSSKTVYEEGQTVYHGTWDGAAIHAEGNGTMDLERFFARSGMQYATGTMRDSDNIQAEIALVRRGN